MNVERTIVCYLIAHNALHKTSNTKHVLTIFLFQDIIQTLGLSCVVMIEECLTLFIINALRYESLIFILSAAVGFVEMNDCLY